MIPAFRGFVRIFVLICSGLFILLLFAQSPTLGGPLLYENLVHFFGLTPALVLKGMVYQLVTWIFFHGSLFHLLFNMLALWMFGSVLEQIWGTGRFIAFCLLAGLVSGISIIGFGFFDDLTFHSPTIGSSGIVFALLIASARLFPNQVVLFFFVFPMRMKFFAWIILALEFYALYTSNQKGISNIAHLGGALFGFLAANRMGGSGFGGGSLDAFKDWVSRRKRRHLRIIVSNDKKTTYH